MSDGTDASEPRRIKSIGTASEILRTVQRRDEPTFTDVADALEQSKGTVHTYLRTLRDEGFLDRTDGVYRLGLRFVPMGESVRNDSALYRAAREEVEDLAEQTDEYVHLTVESRGREVTLDERRGENAVAKDYHLRMRERPQHLHYTATGKAMLAHFERSRLESLLDEQGLPAETERTITDREELYAELAEIREQGYAVNDGEEVRGMRSVGAAIRGIEDEVAGAMSVTAPKRRLSGERFSSEIPDLVMQAANVVELTLETTVFDR